MAYRSFRDAQGREWEAWDVVPRLIERRLSDRRAHRTALGDDERRHGMERRMLRGRRATLSGLEQGWLCFEAGKEKRRLTPIPLEWPRCDDARLAEYCERAVPVSPRAPQAGISLPSVPMPASELAVLPIAPTAIAPGPSAEQAILPRDAESAERPMLDG